MKVLNSSVIHACELNHTSEDADNIVKIWSPSTGELVRNLVGHTKGISDVAWASDSVYLASASDDKTVRVWDIDSVSFPSVFCYVHNHNWSSKSGVGIESSEGSSRYGILC